MSLQEYKKKRNFKKTAEPAGKKHTARKAGLLFTIQKHAASHLHFDLRLEMEGVLRSWAVPKGPSRDPKQRRLAMQVEDHPMEYGDFEGTIPAGEYGGGTVMLWDSGTWELHEGENPVAEWKSGSMKITFHGKRIQGNYAMVRMKPDSSGKASWLLIKEKDDFAEYEPKQDLTDEHMTSVKTRRTMEEIAAGKSRKGFTKAETQRVWNSNRSESSVKKATSKPAKEKSAPKAKRKSAKTKASLPGERFKPQLAVLGSATPSGEGWIHEVKYDGYRVLAYLGGGVELITRGGKDWTHKFRDIEAGLEELKLSGTILDGEIVALDDTGKTNFQLLQNHLRDAVPAPLVYYAFDILYDSGEDVRKLSLLKRKERLEALLGGGNDAVRYSEHFESLGRDVLDEACRLGLEGIISKSVTAKYQHSRSRDWVKSKCTQRQEFVILGYTPPKGSRAGFGALLLGNRETKNAPLKFAGKVGTGFSNASIKELMKDLRPLHTETNPLGRKPAGIGKVQWVEPSLICEVAYTEWTSDGRLRHPSFMGLREDKSAKEITKEKPVAVSSKPAVKREAKPTTASKSRKIPKASATTETSPKGSSKSDAKRPDLLEVFCQVELRDLSLGI